ncbi:MAG: hypothetical protein QGI45_15380 [Myxococcota bacterium]|jgi:hypothetical protein|nr:hypothetical protein [Myxococcota bacterium]
MRALIISLFISLCLSSVSAFAQELEKPSPRQGYYLGYSMSIANANMNHTDNAWLPAWPALGSALRMGEALNQDLALGLSWEFFQGKGKRRSSVGGGVVIEAEWLSLDPYFLRAGAGFAALKVTDKKADDDDVGGNAGSIYAFGIGRDFYPMYPKWSYPGQSGGLTVRTLAQVKYIPGGFSSVFAWFGVEVLWFFGRPKNQLELELNEAFKQES